MSLQFYLGASGTGKSYQLHKDIVEWAAREKNRNFLFIVPDQFTMQTQIDLVNASGCDAIMNIDVLSFSRLAHRIFEELGCQNQVIMDDTGKSLILRQLAGKLYKDMPVLGVNLNKIGYIHEIKSVISEFKQYDIGTEQLDSLIDYAESRGMLKAKLADIRKIYEAFNEYTRNGFITSEEYISILTAKADESKILRDSVIIFDGFTGFTPVQYALIQKLFLLTHRIIFSVTIDINDEPYKNKGEQDFFALSRKTIHDIQKISQAVNVPQLEDRLFGTIKRFGDREDLYHLSSNIFRYPIKLYNDSVENIHICEMANPEAEVKNACINIKRLVLEKGYEYRDIAIVCGSLGAYKDEFIKQSHIYDIPVYIDENRSFVLNPFVEYLRSAMNIINTNFSYQSLFHYLRSGLSDIDRKDIDRLENYVLKCGIKGKKKWTEAFTRLPYKTGADGKIKKENIEALNRLNETRQKVVSGLEPIMKKRGSISDFIEGLYEFILINDIEKRLADYATYFAENDMPEKAKEYSQVYRTIIDLLDQMHKFLKDETIPLSEFIKIFDSGIAELNVGTIPGGVDRIIVGDIERSRLGNIKVLMFLGVNDGYIPKANSGGGLLSDIDREYLKGSSIELSPTPREQIFSQRLYLYLNMSKPSERLYLSYSRNTSDAKPMKASYVLSMIRKMFPKLILNDVAEKSKYSGIVGIKDGIITLSEGLREYASDDLSSLKKEELATLLKVLGDDENVRRKVDSLMKSAFYEYKENPLTDKIAHAIYGDVLANSVSRLEKFSACEYAHFLAYGMKLYEREEQAFETKDLGNVYHSILERFAKSLLSKGYSLSEYPDEVGDELIDEILEQEGINYGESVLHSTNANEYKLSMIRRIVKRSLKTVKTQLAAGSFVPEAFERSFVETVTLSDSTKMMLRGKIDRIDLLVKGDKCYIKIMDYKSSDKDMEIDSLYYGLQLQQPVYLMAAEHLIESKYDDKDIVKAAMLYSKVSDPVLDKEDADDEENLERDIIHNMRPKGLILDDENVIKGLDASLSEPKVKSIVIPVERKTDGSYSANSKIVSTEDLDNLLEYTDKKVKSIGKEILEGHIKMNPATLNDSDACGYCDFKDICTFDIGIKGYQKRVLKKMKSADALNLIKENLRADNKEE